MQKKKIKKKKLKNNYICKKNYLEIKNQYTININEKENNYFKKTK